MGPRLKSPAACTAYAALAYLFLTIIITYPLAFRLGTSIAGVPDNDSLEFIWSIWWFKRSMLEFGANLIDINILNYPDGLSFPLLPAMSQPFVLSLPLASLASPTLAFNVTYLLSFPLCGLAGYWLCTEVSGDRRAGFVGGLIWGFFPNKTGHALAGHLFQMVVFTLPLAALFLLRLLRQPSARNALWAGLALAAAATIHPVNVAYCLLPLALVLVGNDLWPSRHTSLVTRHPPLAWRWIGLAAAIALVLTLPLFLPALVEAARGDLNFLVTGGTVGFSTDAVAFFLPAPGNPLLALTPLRALSEKVVLSEFENIAYVGWLPLLLSVYAARRQPSAGRAWIVLGAVVAVFSLGPLLKFGGDLVRVPVENDSYPVLLPYALLERVPLFQWSRTPGRLNETVMLAVAVLAASGAAEVLRRFRSGRAAWAAFGLACLVIPAEYVVRWPMPLAPIDVPAALGALAEDDSFEAVFNYPVRGNDVNLRSLYQQTYHEHPLIGGRVYRDAPGTLVTHDFLSRVLEAPDGADIAPGPGPDERLRALAFYDVGRVVYQPLHDSDGTAAGALDRWLGAPLARAESLSIYAVEPAGAQSSDLFFVFGENWGAPEAWGEGPGRWFNDVATAYLFSGGERSGVLQFIAVPGRNLRQLAVKLNGAEIARFGVGDWAEFHTPEVALQPGLNRLEFVDLGGAWDFVGDPRCQGGSEVAGPFPLPVPCDAGRQASGQYSLAIQNLRFAGEPAATPLAVFGEAFEFLGAEAPAQAQPGETILLHSLWRAAQPPGGDYTAFAHLLDAAGQYVAGYDSFPARGQHPTSRWAAGEVVAHNVPLTVPAEAAPGVYTLQLGWYDPATGQRLLLANGDSSLEVGPLEIGL